MVQRSLRGGFEPKTSSLYPLNTAGARGAPGSVSPTSSASSHCFDAECAPAMAVSFARLPSGQPLSERSECSTPDRDGPRPGGGQVATCTGGGLDPGVARSQPAPGAVSTRGWPGRNLHRGRSRLGKPQIATSTAPGRNREGVGSRPTSEGVSTPFTGVRGSRPSTHFAAAGRRAQRQRQQRGERPSRASRPTFRTRVALVTHERTRR